jgi:hypothetical protein
VQYGFEVATAVVRWIPYAGWFAGLIMDGYFFGESLVASGVFNFTDWLRGDGGIVENLVDFGVDVGLAFVWLGLDALNTFIPLPPFCCYPPRPPVQGPFLASTMLMDPTTTQSDEFANPAGELLDAVTAPVRNGIGFGAGLLRDAFDRVPVVSDVAEQLVPEAVEETVPEAVEETAEGVGETTPVERIKTSSNQAAQLAKVSETAAKGVARAQGEVRAAVAKAATDVTGAVRAGRPGKVTEEVANGPTTVATGLRDTATKAVNDARQAAKDAREAARGRPGAKGDDE